MRSERYVQEHIPGTRVLMHVLGDKHSPPVDLSEVLDAVRRHPQPALAFITSASRLAPAQRRRRPRRASAGASRGDGRRGVRRGTSGRLRVVVSIRDPYDSAHTVFMDRRAGGRCSPGGRPAGPTVRGMCKRFNLSYRAWLALVDGSRQGASVVRVEDLGDPLDALLSRLARELDLPYPAHVPVAAGTARPGGDARRQPILQRRLGATRWDDAPIAVDAELEERPAEREPLPDLLAAVVTDRIDWSLIKRFDYRPALGAAPCDPGVNGLIAGAWNGATPARRAPAQPEPVADRIAVVAHALLAERCLSRAVVVSSDCRRTARGPEVRRRRRASRGGSASGCRTRVAPRSGPGPKPRSAAGPGAGRAVRPARRSPR